MSVRIVIDGDLTGEGELDHRRRAVFACPR